MAIITYNTDFCTGCIFSSMGKIEEAEQKLAYIMEGFPYNITSKEESE